MGKDQIVENGQQIIQATLKTRNREDFSSETNEQISPNETFTTVDGAPSVDDLTNRKQKTDVESGICHNPFSLTVLKNPTCVIIVVYAIFHFSGMMGLKVNKNLKNNFVYNKP